VSAFFSLFFGGVTTNQELIVMAGFLPLSARAILRSQMGFM